MKPEVTIIPEREKIETPQRGYLTPKGKAQMALDQGGKCGCGCGQKLQPGKIITEHTIPLAIGQKRKPDALWTKQCAAKKTKKDCKEIAKVNRLTGKTGNRRKKKIQSRGFPKNLKRKINGEVEKRD